MVPYTGITGFMSQAEVLWLLRSLPKETNRLLMVGVLASLKTLRRETVRRPNRYPQVETLRNIFISHPRVLNLIHYHTDKPEGLLGDLLALSFLGGPNLHGVQLNIVWPEPFSIRHWKIAHPEMKVVLQIGKQAFNEIAHSPEKLAERIAENYHGLADYVLLDASGGEGKSLDAEHLREYLLALQEQKLQIGLGVAGGLGPDTVWLIEQLSREFPGLCIDAESKLRDEHDHLDLDRTENYLQKALELFGT